MDTSFIKGIIVPMLTPVDANDVIDEAKLRKQVDYVIAGGVHGILAFGSNGEFYMFDQEEMRTAFAIILDQVKGRVPVYFGIGAISTHKCVALAEMAEKMGAKGISVLQPMFLKPTEEELLEHFKTIAHSVPNLPMLLYNNPGRTGYTIPASVVEKLAHKVTNIVGMKDSSGDMTQTEEFIRRTRDVDFKVFGGKDTLVYAAMCHGASGSVCTTANFMPELVLPIYNKFVAGDLKGSLEAQFKLNPVRLSMDKASFPVATKDMANLRGQDVGNPIHPNLPTAEGTKPYELMVAEMKKAGLL
jgi:4-hydroxy-tetrahydrodipicolinate synthase